MALADGSLDASGATTTFKHSLLYQSRREIRLIQILPGLCEEPIRCEVRHVHILEADYVALSYEWGNLDEGHCI